MVDTVRGSEGDDEGCLFSADCCANVCAARGCTEPAPLGCVVDCAGMACATCAADSCACVGESWGCTPKCMDGEAISLQRRPR